MSPRQANAALCEWNWVGPHVAGSMPTKEPTYLLKSAPRPAAVITAQALAALLARWRGGRQHGTGRVRRALCLRERQPGDLRDPAHSRCPSRYQPRQLLPCQRCPTPAAALLRPPRGTRPPPGAHERVAPAGSAGPGSSPSHVSAPSDTRSASSRTRSSPHPPGTFGSPECESPSQRCG